MVNSNTFIENFPKFGTFTGYRSNQFFPLDYNTDINIIGSIPDYFLIYKALPLVYGKDERAFQILVTQNEFNLRTEKSRKRFLTVLYSAFVTENQEINDLTQQLLTHYSQDEESMAILLFWVFSINNKLFYKLNNELFVKYYLQGRAEFPVTTVEAYLKDLIANDPQLKGQWSESTIQTIASKYLTVLKKLHLLEGTQKKRFKHIRINDELFACFIHLTLLFTEHTNNLLNEDFLKFCFSSEEGILERLKKIGKKDWIKMNYSVTILKVEPMFNSNTIVDGIFGRS